MGKKRQPKNPNSTRSKVKFPGLKRKYTLADRQDYFEGEYADGVKNEEGEVVIRPLNDEEKAWLNAFNEEFVNIRVCESDNPRFVLTGDERRAMWKLNYSRQCCVFNIKKARGGLDPLTLENVGYIDKQIGVRKDLFDELLILCIDGDNDDDTKKRNGKKRE